jgi:hypothetical protein
MKAIFLSFGGFSSVNVKNKRCLHTSKNLRIHCSLLGFCSPRTNLILKVDIKRQYSRHKPSFLTPGVQVFFVAIRHELQGCQMVLFSNQKSRFG